jgi:hypothetical protein
MSNEENKTVQVQEAKTFGVSQYLAAIHQRAPEAAVAAEVGKLLALLGETDPAVAQELAKGWINRRELADLLRWNAEVAPKAGRNRCGNGACQFLAAQVLATTVMRDRALDGAALYSPGVGQAMAMGAVGLFEAGRPQFFTLGWLANELVKWLAQLGIKRVGLIEAPLGNTLPVQVVADAAERHGVVAKTVAWNAPRNDRPARGQTVEETAQACAAELEDVDLVVFLDEAVTGTRFDKMWKALAKVIAKERLLPIVMIFGEPKGMPAEKLKSVIRRVESASKALGYGDGMWRFAPPPLFFIDAGAPFQWKFPMIWNESDLIAGKRKVNLIFTLLAHCFVLLKDLASATSTYRSYLELAWHADTSGWVAKFAPGLIEETFKGIVEAVSLDEIEEALGSAARARFPDDCAGTIARMTKDDAVAFANDVFRTGAMIFPCPIAKPTS